MPMSGYPLSENFGTGALSLSLAVSAALCVSMSACTSGFLTHSLPKALPRMPPTK